jgi:hypothetical protein
MNWQVNLMSRNSRSTCNSSLARLLVLFFHRTKDWKPDVKVYGHLILVPISIILSPSFSRSLQVASRFMAIKVADAASIFQPSLDRTAHTTTNWQCRARLSVDRPTEYRPDVEGKPTRLKENPSKRLDRMQVRYNLSSHDWINQHGAAPHSECRSFASKAKVFFLALTNFMSVLVPKCSTVGPKMSWANFVYSPVKRHARAEMDCGATRVHMCAKLCPARQGYDYLIAPNKGIVCWMFLTKLDLRVNLA